LSINCVIGFIVFHSAMRSFFGRKSFGSLHHA
jgi:hypothetical protein